MRKFTIILAILIISIQVNAQSFLGVSILTKGVGVQIGTLAHKIEISAGVKFPQINQEQHTIYNLSLGKMILLTKHEEDNYSITTSIGIANYKFSSFDAKAERTIHSSIKSIYGLELGKDAFMGRVYVRGLYCANAYLEVGMKIFTNTR